MVGRDPEGGREEFIKILELFLNFKIRWLKLGIKLSQISFFPEARYDLKPINFIVNLNTVF
jgi:hypothetical protein